MTRPYGLHLGDALEFMAGLSDASVDAIITDPPYGTTQIEWDKPVDWERFWSEARRVCKQKAPCVMFAAQPFTTDLINSNRKGFRYAMVWPKTTTTGYLNAKRRPLTAHEDVLVFGDGLGTYNPQMWDSGKAYSATRRALSEHYGAQTPNTSTVSQGERHPTTVLPLTAGQQANAVHPTQKPVDLLVWLVRTYTNAGDLILDPFAGSGTTGVAALKNGRRFMGSELSPEYHAVALERLQAAHAQPRLLEAL